MSSRKLRFVIIEKDSFVARDMQDGLLAAVPDCDTFHLAHHDDASDALRRDAVAGPADEPRMVIVTKLSLDQIDSSGLARAAYDAGAEMVVRMGDDPVGAVASRGWYSLASPFTWDDLSALVGSLSGRTTAA